MKWEVRDNGRTVVQPTDTGFYLIAQQLHPEHAKIIAAAPELLAACEALDKDWTELFKLKENQPYEHFVQAETKRIWDLCRAAISKSKGTL